MKASVALLVAIMLIFGVTVVVLGRLYKVQVTLTGPFNERHDVNLGYPTPSNYSIGPGNSVNLAYNLTSGTLVRAIMTISGGSGRDINFYIKNSTGHTVFNAGRVSITYSYNFTAQKDDTYRVYMDNTFSTFSTKTVYYRVIEAYYTEIVYEPRTAYLTLTQQYPWLEWIGIGAILVATCILAFFGLKFLNSRVTDRQRKAAQARAEEEARMKSERELAAERERQRLRMEEERRRTAMRQDADNFMKAGRYEDAAKIYEQLGMWDEAGECRRLGKTTYVVAADVHVGKDGISVNCPHCGSSERLESKVSEVTCRHCGRTYFVPKKILDMI